MAKNKQTQVAMIIEKKVRSGLTYLEALIEYCEEYNIEPEKMGKFINESLKGKLEVECEGLHLLPKISRLPV
jgi:hypothetical protein